MKPKIESTINGYKFIYSNVTLSVTRLISHNRDGRITGEISILNGEGLPLYPQTSFNFTSDTTRNRLAKTLKEHDTNHDWNAIINQVSLYVVDTLRKGEPVITLNTIGETKPPEYYLHPLIIKNYPNVLFGDPSSAKSILAVVLAQVLILPWSDNPMGFIAPPKTIKVLYLDWETDADTIRWQTKMLERGMDTGPLYLEYRRCEQPLANEAEQVKIHIANSEADVVIIDSLGLAAGGELKETTPALAFYSALRQLKTTPLILAHNSKDREAKSRSIYGNQFFTAQARNIWEVRKTQEPNSNECDIALFHRKPPPFAGLHRPLGFKLSFNDDKLRISMRDPKSVPEFLEQMGTRARVRELLKSGKFTPKQVAAQLDITDGNARKTLYDLKVRNEVGQDNNGSYFLCYQE